MDDGSSTLDIRDIPANRLLAALYEFARPAGDQRLANSLFPEPLTTRRADEVLRKAAECQASFLPFVEGRFMGIAITVTHDRAYFGDQLDPTFYDMRNGDGRAASAVKWLREEETLAPWYESIGLIHEQIAMPAQGARLALDL